MLVGLNFTFAYSFEHVQNLGKYLNKAKHWCLFNKGMWP